MRGTSAALEIAYGLGESVLVMANDWLDERLSELSGLLPRGMRMGIASYHDA